MIARGEEARRDTRDLLRYHAASHGLLITPVLVLVPGRRPDTITDGVAVVSGNTLTEFLGKSLDAAARLLPAYYLSRRPELA